LLRGGLVGDIMQARSRAAEAKSDIEIGYAIPREARADVLRTISRFRPMPKKMWPRPMS